MKILSKNAGWLVRTLIMAIGASCVMFVTSCATATGHPNETPLRIGVSPDYPPLIFKRDGKLAGLEVHFAKELSKELGRPLKFVSMKWDKQIPMLEAEKTDIIMSGMSITRARELRIVFSEPYIQNGLMALIRRKDAHKYDSAEDIVRSHANVGVQEGTTGDAFVQQKFPYARRVVVATPEDAAFNLRSRFIDMFIHDAHAVAWLVSENEADLTGVWTSLNEEYLAWGIRRHDQQLLDDVNAALAKWEKDGTLEAILERWLPYAERFKVQ